jgi:SulP family sulfate permease
MTGRRHRSNAELVAQGIANIGSALFGGVPATGAIARTATNIRAGARSPIAGMLHAVFLLVFMLVAAPVLSYVPLAVLAGILTIVAWNISEIAHIRQIMANATMGDRAVLIATFLLTVLVDLTVGIQVGVVLAAILFMHRMANAFEVQTETSFIEPDLSDSTPRDHAVFDGSADGKRFVVYRINGPFFFGATQKFLSVLDRIGVVPDTYIFDFSGVPFVDSTAATALKGFVEKARERNGNVILAGASPALRHTLRDFGIRFPDVRFSGSVEAAAEESGRG